MVGNDERILAFLSQLHETPAREGLEATLRTDRRFPSARSIYRWHDRLGVRLTYFPAISYSALGLATVHVIVDSPRGAWDQCPYAVAGKWMTTGTRRLLYLRCLIPREHVAIVCERLHAYASRQGTHCEIIPTADALHTFLGDGSRASVAISALSLPTTSPFIIPVIAEMAEHRRSLTETWERIYRRVGEQVHVYLKRRRVNVTNGKAYVQQAMAALIAAHTVSTHVIRYEPLNEGSVEATILTHAADDLLGVLGSHALCTDTFPQIERGALLIARVTLQGLKELLASSQAQIIGFADDLANTAAPISPRWAYEELFDPQKGWRLPTTIIPEEYP